MQKRDLSTSRRAIARKDGERVRLYSFGIGMKTENTLEQVGR